MSEYKLRVITWSGSGVQFRQEETYVSDVFGPAPAVGDLLTVHPTGEISDASFSCTVTGVQRVIRGRADEGLPSQSSVHVTAKRQVS